MARNQGVKVRTSSRTKDTAVTYIEPDSSDDEAGAVAPASGTKRKRKATAKGTASASTNQVASSSTAAPAPTAASTPERPVKRRRGKRGVLEQLVEMPMDLLFEVGPDVFSLLDMQLTTEPPDLWQTRSY